MSLLGTFEIGTRSLRAFQAAMQTVSHNLANVNTPGYSRQRVTFETDIPDQTGAFLLGRGINLSNVERLRDRFFEDQWRRESSVKTSADATAETYNQIETILQEPGDTGLNSQMDKFHTAWLEAANSPNDAGLRATLRVQGKTLVERFNATRHGLETLRTDTDEKIRIAVVQVNSYAGQINELNRSIKQSMLQGFSPNDSMDKRDYLIGELAKLVPVNTVERQDGGVAVYVGGVPLVEETGTSTVVADFQSSGTGMVALSWENYDEPVDFDGGKIGTLLSNRDTLIPDVINKLDALAQALVDGVNALHRTGMGTDGTIEIKGSVPWVGALEANATAELNGVSIAFSAGDNLATVVAKLNAAEAQTGVHARVVDQRVSLVPSATNPQTIRVSDDPDGVFQTLGVVNDFFQGEPGNFQLSDAVASDLRHIALSATGAPGDNAIARNIAALWDQPMMENSQKTFNVFHQEFLTDLGSRSQAATSNADNQGFLVTQIDNLRESVSGISTDEELSNMIRYQRSYDAAARTIRVADEMMQTLLNLVQ